MLIRHARVAEPRKGQVTMEQLIGQITQRTGISEEQARQAVETVMGYLKGHLPPALAAQLDGALSGDMSAQGSLGEQAQAALGGLFGKK